MSTYSIESEVFLLYNYLIAGFRLSPKSFFAAGDDIIIGMLRFGSAVWVPADS